MRLSRFAAFAALVLAGPLIAEEPSPISLGEAHVVTTHDSERRINVLLPLDYEESDNAYPLVFVLDGGEAQDIYLAHGIHTWNQLWGRSQPAIIIGVETVDRQRELLPPSASPQERERYPTAGEADAFRQWLIDDVMPMVRARYRENGTAILVGESAAGHFVAETWMTRPEAFDAYAALSPSLQWDNQSLSRKLSGEPPIMRPPLFLSLADEGGATEEGALRFVNAAGDAVCFADRRSSHVRHANTMHQLLADALQFLLPTDADWLEEYGFVVECSEVGETK
ncbi:iroE protein [Erythrobacter sp. KY5]|uniref:alpha/beta hydrolase n=1 Tax=Erythrobacter sp. KY5 TaxID=2011159 RepID=UPI000DBF25D9|nr:alpha/beta hydrolase-fold protein [Erythrobacter sp. KY5]AWW74516.1 iroE protein [Erythrobacter sp. KY5]